MIASQLEGGRLWFEDETVLADVRAPTITGADIDWRVTPHGAGVWEFGVRVSNTGDVRSTVTSADAFAGRLVDEGWQTLHFTSDWGEEFAPVRQIGGEVRRGLSLVGRAGRSSRGLHPLLAASRGRVTVLISVAWSGNWHIDLDHDGRIRAGISPHDFAVDLAPGEGFEAPHVFVAVGRDLDAAGAALSTTVGRLIPRTEWSDRMPTEWNHWWPYEDVDIDERVFAAEAAAASALGFEVATLDAGWFGRPEAASDWQAERGDWAAVNTARFPAGLPALADATRADGIGFGIWIEAEAVGAGARLRTEHPELLATRSAPDGVDRMTVSLDATDPTFLGYVCLGSPAGRRFVARSLDDAVSTTGAVWLKLDFNVDPGSGCDRSDHGHGPGDGLLRHYEGLYSVLDEFRARHPGVVLEACASGGLRIDLGLARHVHCFFLSDPDWTEHHLQVLWGASLMLPPAAMLHWSWSEWRGENPDQDVDFESLASHRVDTMLRAAMLHRFGVSMRLTALPPTLRARVAAAVATYRADVAPMLRRGVLRRLTDAPLRRGGGERTPAFQVDDGDTHLLAVFALDEDSTPPRLRFSGLDPSAHYDLRDPTGTAPSTRHAGERLMTEGVPAGVEASSWLLLASRSAE